MTDTIPGAPTARASADEAGADEVTAVPALAAQSVRADVVGLLGHDVPDDADLFDEGLDSVRLMALVERWRAAGSTAGFLDLVQEPTLAAWTERVAR